MQTRHGDRGSGVQWIIYDSKDLENKVHKQKHKSENNCEQTVEEQTYVVSLGTWNRMT